MTGFLPLGVLLSVLAGTAPELPRYRVVSGKDIDKVETGLRGERRPSSSTRRPERASAS